VERLSEREKECIAELAAQGLPSRLIGKQIGRHNRTVCGYMRVTAPAAGPAAETVAVAVVVDRT
jgi:DNA-binding NarL/FixJ family response regulator